MQYMTVLLAWADVPDADEVRETLAGAIEELASAEGIDLGIRIEYEIHDDRLIETTMKEER